jgi:hypothetical protein
MWTIDSTDAGIGKWDDGTHCVKVDARGAGHGIELDCGQGAPISLCPIDSDALPAACEQYVRGDQWHLNYPQGESSYALRLSLEPLESKQGRMVIETCVSIQTDLLDLYPKLDIETDCNDIDSIVPGMPGDHDIVAGSGTAPISIAKSESGRCSILLGPHDHPFTTNHSTDTKLRLRLFGDFLEKGVIRRARLWIVVENDAAYETSALEETWQRLSQSPLPLT